jgi:hypothetical protein
MCAFSSIFLFISVSLLQLHFTPPSSFLPTLTDCHSITFLIPDTSRVRKDCSIITA